MSQCVCVSVIQLITHYMLIKSSCIVMIYEVSNDVHSQKFHRMTLYIYSEDHFIIIAKLM